MLIIHADGSEWIRDDDGNELPYRWYHRAKDSAMRRLHMRPWNKMQESTQELLNDKAARFYGDGGTIHSTRHLHVGVYQGKVVSVWFRCQALPFEQIDVDKSRAEDMRNMYSRPICTLHGVTVKDPTQ